MNTSSLPIEFLTSQERHDIGDQPYNPAPEYNDSYEREHEETHVQMKKALHGFGGGQKYGSHSFEYFDAMEDCWTVSRYVAAYLTDPVFIRPDLVRYLYDLVLNFKHDYMLHIYCQIEAISEFEVILTKDRIRIYIEDEDDLKRICKG